ncbi:MAG: GGDEF domain-containing protein [Acholeplasmatales bacterium]|nr:GGDEF domain-containing protein [Acholeplasmatales bacterium]
MYKAEDLLKYDYFKEFSLEYILDPLTGVVSRGYILEFAQSLIDSKTPFSFIIMDIDNFKLVNDYYGHSVGDECLVEIGRALIEAVGDTGVVGRYGGDEFVIVYLGDTSYDGQKLFLTSLFGDKKVVRRSLCLSSVHIFITGTIGSASYPRNAETYEDLFLKCDKALYRGKTKGRNCYIIYVEEKHKDIDPHKSEAVSIPEMMIKINAICKTNIDKSAQMSSILEYLSKAFGISDAFIMFNDSTVISTIDRTAHKIPRLKITDIDLCFSDEKDDTLVLNKARDAMVKSPGLNRFLAKRHDQAIIISKLCMLDNSYGYIVFLENKIQRIWQEKEAAMAIYASKILAFLVSDSKK